MRKSSIAAAALCLTVVAGCNDFLNSPKAVADPNAPTQATTNQLFVAALANTFGNQEGAVAMLICQWMQQCAGVNGRFVETQGNYTIDASTFDIPFQNIYNGGGLIGLRTIEANTAASGELSPPRRQCCRREATEPRTRGSGGARQGCESR